MDKRFLAPLGIGLAVIAMAVAGVFYMQRGAHVELKGAILKVRTQAMDENSCVAIVDFRFANPSNYPFVVRTVDVTMEDKDGKPHQGSTVSEPDAIRLFQYYPALGQKYNSSLIMSNKIGPRLSEDRMIAARFEVSVEKLDARKQIKVRIEDVDGPVSELVGK
jgi:hypothetical protein